MWIRFVFLCASWCLKHWIPNPNLIHQSSYKPLYLLLFLKTDVIVSCVATGNITNMYFFYCFLSSNVISHNQLAADKIQMKHKCTDCMLLHTVYTTNTIEKPHWRNGYLGTPEKNKFTCLTFGSITKYFTDESSVNFWMVVCLYFQNIGNFSKWI